MSPSSTSVRFESPWPCLLAAADQRPGDTRSARLLHVSEKSAEQRGCLAASLTFWGPAPRDLFYTFIIYLLFIYFAGPTTVGLWATIRVSGHYCAQ